MKRKPAAIKSLDEILNSNPEGCNQHTGPGCGVGGLEGDFPRGSKVAGQKSPGGKLFRGTVVGYGKDGIGVIIKDAGGKRHRVEDISVSKLGDDYPDEDLLSD